MKQRTIPIMAGLVALAFVGCTWSSQKNRTPFRTAAIVGTNVVFSDVAYKESKATTYCVVNADQTYKLRVQNGSEVQVIGAGGDQKAEGVQMLEATGTLLDKAAALKTGGLIGGGASPTITSSGITLPTGKSYPATYKKSDQGEFYCWTDETGKTNCIFFPK